MSGKKGKVYLYRFNHFYHWNVCYGRMNPSSTKKRGKRKILIKQGGCIDLHHNGEGRRELLHSSTFESQPNSTKTRHSATVTERSNDREGRDHRIIVEHAIVFDHTSFSLHVTVRMKRRRACSCFQ